LSNKSTKRTTILTSSSVIWEAVMTAEESNRAFRSLTGLVILTFLTVS
jgi:hypothetical protein